MKIAFQGIKGAYTEEAIYKHFGEEVQTVGFNLSEEVFQALEEGEVDMGFLPVENSIAGNVAVNLDLLYQYPFFATIEAYHRINHCLLATPGTKLSEIERVYSHPIALSQCHRFINRHHLQSIPEYDTAGAAKHISELKDPSIGAIASGLCADHYNLEILESHIQTIQNNITRFLGFCLQDRIPKDLKAEKTSLAFSVKHHPGALLNCLQKFAENEINLTKLESRPIPEDPFKYIFFADFQGGHLDANVQKCLTQMKEDADHIKILGSYPVGIRPE